MKRIIVAFLVIVAGSIPTLAQYSGGTGEPNTPYQIANVADLMTLANDANDYNKCFILTADVNMQGQSFTTAIIAATNAIHEEPFQGISFTGTFNGNNHKITNFNINGGYNSYLGLFGQIGSGGSVQNISVEDVNVSGSDYVGSLAGWNYGSISNCFSAGSVSGSLDVGGLVGQNVDGNISNCYSKGQTSGISDETGGLVGWNSGSISNSYSTCSVSCPQRAGGLIGQNNSSGSIGNSYSTGSVSGSDGVGGLVGNSAGSISNCYSTGPVSGDTNVGGLVGRHAVSIVGSFWDINTSGQTTSAGGTGETTAEMMTKSTFTDAGWDFNNIWWINEKVDYPKLYWQLNVTKCSVTAGSKGDSISFSGTMEATANDFNDANSSSDANFVEVTISDENSNDMDPCVITFPVNGKTWKKGKFSYSGTVNGVKKSFSYVVKTGKFTFAASNINLSGLECPMIIDINVGSYIGTAEVNETIVNGPKTPIPINLLMGVKNSLRIDKSKFTKKSGSITQFAISGGFSVQYPDVNMTNRVSEDLVVTLGTQTFTIPANNLKAGKGKFTCSKANVNEGGIATATFDFNKCTFTLTIKNVDITNSGTVDFCVQFAGFSERVQVTLP